MLAGQARRTSWASTSSRFERSGRSSGRAWRCACSQYVDGAIGIILQIGLNPSAPRCPSGVRNVLSATPTCRPPATNSPCGSLGGQCWLSLRSPAPSRCPCAVGCDPGRASTSARTSRTLSGRARRHIRRCNAGRCTPGRPAAELEGTRKRRPLPPPPHDAKVHTWHHPDRCCSRSRNTASPRPPV